MGERAGGGQDLGRSKDGDTQSLWQQSGFQRCHVGRLHLVALESIHREKDKLQGVNVLERHKTGKPPWSF